MNSTNQSVRPPSCFKGAVLFFFWLSAGSFSCAVAQGSNPWWKSIFSNASLGCEQIPDSALINPDHGQPQVVLVRSDQSLFAAEQDGTKGSEKGAEPQATRPVGSIELQVDSRVMQLDSIWKSTPRSIRGFRVQIFAGELQEARATRAQVRKLSNEPVYITSMAPNYRITVGDYRDKWSAEKAKEFWLSMFPQAIVIPMEIELPPLPLAKGDC